MATQDGRETTFEKVFALFAPRGKLQSLLSRPQAPSKADAWKILDGVDYRARLYTMIKLGAAAASNQGIRDFLTQLEEGDFTDRSLALSSVYGSKDGGHVMRGLADRSKAIRSAAISLSAIACTDEQCSDILVAAKPKQRLAIIRALSRRSRRIAIEGFLRKIEKLDPGSFVSLAAYASQTFISEAWATLEPLLTPELWTRLARQHPEFATTKIRELASQASTFDPRILLLANSVLRVIAKCQPELTIALVKDLVRLFPLAKLQIQGVIPFKTAEIAKLVIEHDAKGAFILGPSLHKLAPQLVNELIERELVSTARGDAWLKRFSASDRSAIFRKGPDAWRSSDGHFSVGVLRLLPCELRERYAAEHFASPQLQTKPEQRLPYIQLLPWDKARTAAESFLADPDAALRALALAPLISSVRFSRASTTEMLGLVKERRFEQDPVRMVMLQAVAGLPPSLWKGEHLENIGAMIRSALDAKDLSVQSLTAIHQLLLRLLPFHFEHAAQWLATVLKERSVAGIGNFESALSNEQVRSLAPFILPVLKSWKTRENENALLRVASSFGKRLVEFEALVALVEDLTEEASSSSISESALNVLRHRCRIRFTHLVPRLLKSDATWSLKQPVITYLHEHRTDLLTPYLGQSSIAGKFSTGKTRIVPSFSDGFHRWTSAQRRIYRDSLSAMTTDLTRKTNDFFYALRMLSFLPEPPLDIFLTFTRITTPEHAVVRDYAVQMLASLDGGEGLDELVQCLDDDRARVAIYSFRTAIEELPSPRALTLLEGVPRKKLTVFKETIRLIGELKSPEAHASLLDIAKGELGRDVRIALHRALWDYLENHETWKIFHASGALGDAAISLHLSRIPSERFGELSRREFLKLLCALFERPDPRLRVALLNRVATMPILDEELVLKDSLLRSLESENADEFTAAANALLSTYALRSPAVVEAAGKQILPRRRNLSALVSATFSAFGRERSTYTPSVRALLAALSGDAKTSGIQAALLVAVSSWEEIQKSLFEAVTTGTLHAGTIAAYISALHTAGNRPDASELDRLEQTLAAHPSEQIRRFGLAALVGAAGGNRGWTEVRLARLNRYRADPSPLVAEAAEFTFPATELSMQRAATAEDSDRE